MTVQDLIFYISPYACIGLGCLTAYYDNRRKQKDYATLNAAFDANDAESKKCLSNLEKLATALDSKGIPR